MSFITLGVLLFFKVLFHDKSDCPEFVDSYTKLFYLPKGLSMQRFCLASLIWIQPWPYASSVRTKGQPKQIRQIFPAVNNIPLDPIYRVFKLDIIYFEVQNGQLKEASKFRKT